MRNDNQKLYNIWLFDGCGGSPKYIEKVLDKYGTAKKAFEANISNSDFYKVVGIKNYLKFDTKLDVAEKILDECNKKKIDTISIDEERYPQRLKEMNNPPLVLYTKGNIPDLNKIIAVTIVGSRECSENSLKIVQNLGSKLAEDGFIIVSGMALGIDGAAHSGALSAGGTTLAVLAGGVDCIYPSEHKKLYDLINESGGIISEQPPGVIGKRYFYKERNRIMVGLSAGVVIAEGSVKSGTSITAKLAYENNRDLFAIPGSPSSEGAELPNALIKDGAKLTTDALDIIEEYVDIYPEALKYGISLKCKPVVGELSNLISVGKKTEAEDISVNNQPEKSNTDSVYDRDKILSFIDNSEFSGVEKMVLRYILSCNGKVQLDDISEECGIDITTLSSILLVLQMKRIIIQSAGQNFEIDMNCTGQ